MASGGKASSIAATEIFSQGGNIVDAVVAAAFCLAVERPNSLGLGGGGFLTLVLRDNPQSPFFIDFRESAPQRARRDMFLDKRGKVVPELSQIGALSVAVPGFVAGFFEVHRRWGKLPWKTVLKPSIKLARDGFRVYPTLADRIASEYQTLAAHTYTASLVSARVGTGLKTQPLKSQDLLVQKDLADSLSAIANGGQKAFYQGALGRKIAAFIKARKGILSQTDLLAYRVIDRAPLQAAVLDSTVITAPPPSAGGALFIQWSRVLAGYDRTWLTQSAPRYLHLLAETMKRGFADRSQFFGDPEFTKEPWARVITQDYADASRKSINSELATPSQSIKPGTPFTETAGTSHLSIIDDLGNAVSTTLSINDTFGSRLAVPGTGIFLNNTMDDFSILPGEPNVYGLTGGEANAIAPLKRPTSSMMPTVLLKNGTPVLAIGGAGGSRITSSVAQVVFNLWFHYPDDLDKSQAAPRIHHQWLPDNLEIEKGAFDDTIRGDLRARGHQITDPPYLAKVQAVFRNSSTRVITAVVDPRDDGAGASAQ